MAIIVHTDCCWYVGDEDCHKCLLKGLLFNCTNCPSYDDPHACDPAPAKEENDERI